MNEIKLNEIREGNRLPSGVDHASLSITHEQHRVLMDYKRQVQCIDGKCIRIGALIRILVQRYGDQLIKELQKEI